MAESEMQEAAKKALERVNNIDTYSPMMQNYIETKSKYADCILCYRLGDFFEMFFEDAILVSRELELTLTGKDCGQEQRAPMCGIPHHALDSYCNRLVERGYKVAICEQLEDPRAVKGIVKRDVIKVITPGTIVEGNLLEEKKNNFIMSVYKEGMFFGIGVCDISTGDFFVTELKEDNNFSKLLDEISRYQPSEIIINKMMSESEEEMKIIKQRFDTYISVEGEKAEEVDTSEKAILTDDEGVVQNVGKDAYRIEKANKMIWRTSDQLTFSNDVKNIINSFIVVDKNDENVDIKKKLFAICAINGVMNYIQSTQKQIPQNLNRIIYYEPTKYMSLDISCRRNLEITEKLRDKTKKGTLLWVLDKTHTSMGGRLLRRWVSDPLIDVNDINLRLNAVKELKEDIILRDDAVEKLNRVYDIERLAGKISYGTANARDLISLKNSISQLPRLKVMLSKAKSQLLKNLYESLDTLDDVFELIDKSIVDDPPLTVKEAGLIKKGYNPVVDELIDLTTNGQRWLANIETKEKELTGIKNLKVSYNKVFGYFIEVSKGNIGLVPQDRYIRKQTLTTGERYITEELKNMENQIIGAQEKIVNIEYDEFVKIRDQVEENSKRLQIAANIVSKIDCLCSLAQVADDMNYCMPIVDNSETIEIKEGRHPVIEKILPTGSFVGNDVFMDTDSNSLNIITGPNMAGKSTYMRQVALITLMAQIGSFVPATSAHIGVVDKIFTRVGASDDLAMGESTFMVEMMEVATILKNATKKSLVILDEIGRGTSTYDGMAIAWAVAEYIAGVRTKALFATHYHELVELENKIENVKNYHISVKEKGEDIIFLRKIVEGGTDESYGVHVAKLAGVPKDVTKRADDILKTFEKKSLISGTKQTMSEKAEEQGQLSMYNYKLAELAHELDQVKLDEITPIDALNILSKMKDKMK